MASPADTATGQARDATNAANTAVDNLDPSKMNPEQLDALKKQQAAQGAQNTAQGVTDAVPTEKPSSLKISISLDLDVEVHLTARVKGDIVIGLL